MNIYELTAQLNELQALAGDPDVDPQILADTMEAVQGDFDVKVEGYCKVIKNLEYTITGIKEEVDRLNAKRKSVENTIERMKETMFNSMKAAGLKKAGGDIFTVSVQKKGGVLPLIMDVDDDAVPDEYCTFIRKVDTKAIRALLDKGDKSKLAHYGERGEMLRIK